MNEGRLIEALQRELARKDEIILKQTAQLMQPRQSGMEQQHEANTLAVINFLARHNIRLYDGGWDPNTIEGMEKPKGKTMSVEQRLRILDEKIGAWQRDGALLREEQREHRIAREHMLKAEDLLEHLWRLLVNDAEHCNYQEAVTELDTYLQERRPHIFEEKPDGTDGV